MTPEEIELKKKNRRTGLILATVAFLFFFGIMARKILEPAFLSGFN